MKRNWLIVLTLCLLIAGLVACSTADSNTEGEAERTTEVENNTAEKYTDLIDSEPGSNDTEVSSNLEYYIPDFDALFQMKDSEATLLVGPQTRDAILEAWGEPDSWYDPEDDYFNHDTWMILDYDGITYLFTYWDSHTGLLSEIVMRGTNGMVTADITEYNNGVVWKSGATPKYWDDMSIDEFSTWIKSQTDTDAILERFDGMTRDTVRGLMHSSINFSHPPFGCYADATGQYLGDVFDIWDEETDISRFVCVEYDDVMHTIPMSVSIYRGTDDTGEYLNAPEFANGELFAYGDYNSVEYEVEWIEQPNG